MKNVKQITGICIAIIIFLIPSINAQDSSGQSGAAQANNPLANMTALNFHNYFANTYGTRELQEEAQMIVEDRNNRQSGVKLKLNEWQKARRKYQAATTDKSKGRMTLWINPAEYAQHE